MDILTERDMLIGLFGCLIAIGERLTGREMTVTVTAEKGETIGIGRGASVAWGELIEPPAAAETHRDLPGEQHSTLPIRRSWRCSI
jgi:hypothetical protein